MHPVGGSSVSAIAAMAFPLGAGNARYRLQRRRPDGHGVPGVFRKQTLELGGFDESFLRTQDYELNHRIRKAGGVVCRLGTRSPLPAATDAARLARQYFQYGRAKRQFAAAPGRLAAQAMGLRRCWVVGPTLSLIGTLIEPRLLVLPASMPDCSWSAASSPSPGQGPRQSSSLQLSPSCTSHGDGDS